MGRDFCAGVSAKQRAVAMGATHRACNGARGRESLTSASGQRSDTNWGAKQMSGVPRSVKLTAFVKRGETKRASRQQRPTNLSDVCAQRGTDRRGFKGDRAKRKGGCGTRQRSGQTNFGRGASVRCSARRKAGASCVPCHSGGRRRSRKLGLLRSGGTWGKR